MSVLQGAARMVRVWLSDDRSEAVLQASAGVEGDTIVRLVPRTVGEWRLWARALDANSCDANTGVVRVVSVQP